MSDGVLMSRYQGVGLLLAGIALGGIVMWSVMRGDGAGPDVAVSPEDVSPIGATLQDDGYIEARTKGAPDAPITVWEVSDFQCPFCQKFFAETLPILEREYIATGAIRFVFVNFPIPQLHPNAPAAHEFAMCAAQQNRFWPVHDLLYRHQRRWGAADDPAPVFRELADSAALARPALEECFTSGAMQGLIQAEAQTVYRAGINSTPSFMIEGGLLSGAHPIETWRPILDSLLAARRR